MLRLLVLATVVFASNGAAQITNYVASAGYLFPPGVVVAPGQVISLFVQGLNVPNAKASTVPWPTTLSGVRVVVPNPPNSGYPAALPVFSVSSYPDACGGGLSNFCNVTDIVVQFPYEPICIPDGEPNACTIGGPHSVLLAVQVGGVLGQQFLVSPNGAPHVLNSCDSIYGRPSGVCNQQITHGDGTLVGPVDRAGVSPAHPGETVAIYAVGLGGTLHSKTGQTVSTPDSLPGDVYFTPAIFSGTALQFSPAIKADWAGLVPGYVGLYQINVRLPETFPSSMPPCSGAEGGNLRLYFGLFFGSQFLFQQDAANAAPFTDVCVTTK